MYNSKYKIDLDVNNIKYKIFDINQAARDAGFNIKNLPFTLRILFENMVRLGSDNTKLSIFKDWLVNRTSEEEINFLPARVLMQDFTGVPAIVDLAAMRDAIPTDPLKINPLIAVDLVIDHSVQVDSFGDNNAFNTNVIKEMERNKERYEFLKWGQGAFRNFRVVPPGTGICHQVNLEYLSQVVYADNHNGELFAYPDTLVGTDSHTTMVNGLAVLGWGVGGIEAEAAMLGQFLPMILPEVVGVKLSGSLQGIITATDLVLTLTQLLRQKGVVGKFVEFYGEGLANLSLADRATIANMAPEYGATCGFFAIDEETIKYLKLTARSSENIERVSKYAKAQNLWHEDDNMIKYSDILEVDLSKLETSLAGPKRPQDRVSLANVAYNFKKEIESLAKGENKDIEKEYEVEEENYKLNHGKVVIAAITSCTNTSNPSVMVAAGLLAKRACELGLKSKPWVKTSLAPGSKVSTEYFTNGGLDKYLDNLGFNLVGYGCTTCIGNSGPLPTKIADCISKNELVVSSVLSGNRNFEGRIHPLVRANYLASPPLVVAYALAGDININLETSALGHSKDGSEIYLKDIWPSSKEIQNYINHHLSSKIFEQKYSDVFLGDEYWQTLKTSSGNTYEWDKNSTYIKNPPYFTHSKSVSPSKDIKGAKILAIFGDSITTDHISPAGSIAISSPAGKYLTSLGVSVQDFNSYGARRGNHEVMMRGTFSNNRIKNEMCLGKEGGITINQLSNIQESIYDTAMSYMNAKIPSVIFAGKEYGTGSSRDWAAKGSCLLGVKAIIAESFERIHRSNLAGMGVLPIIFKKGESRLDLKLDGNEEIDIIGIEEEIYPMQELTCVIRRKNNIVNTINVILQIQTENEVEYIKYGSIMHNVVRKLTNI